MKKRLILVIVVIAASLCSAYAQDLSISASDLRVTQGLDGGFHLYIRKKPSVQSVLLTESVRDPDMRAANYAYRALNWNPVNGDEIRVLDGAPLAGLWSLIDSTPEPHPEFGQAFHIYIPYIIQYGYADSRHGEVYVGNGTYLNVCAFEKPYGDHTGAFRDNSFMLEVSQKPLNATNSGKFMKDAEDAFRAIAQSTGGGLTYAAGANDITDKIRAVLQKVKTGDTVDMVFVVDTTNSMKDYLDALKVSLPQILQEEGERFTTWRAGIVFFRDYGEDYIVKIENFVNTPVAFKRAFDKAGAKGGRDIPEAVYEGLFEAATQFPWRYNTRLAILIGDAPPHPRARGIITRDNTMLELNKSGVKVEAVVVSQ